MHIGIVAASSAVPLVELSMGLDRLRQAGFTVSVHPHTSAQHFTFAGTDEHRAQAIFDYAISPDIDALWCARGGYGATRILPLLEQLASRHGTPKPKLLVGYSDVTVLHEFVRNRWGWKTLHATMPAALNFYDATPAEWDATVSLVNGQLPASLFPQPLQFLHAPSMPIDGELVGGNLTLWACLAGTRYAPSAQGKILFFEDLGEAWYRIDRMMVQLEQAGMLAGAQAIVLGDFKDCKDETLMVRRSATDDSRVPLRHFYSEPEAMEEVFGTLARRLNIPLAFTLPVGHGPHFTPLPLGATYRLRPEGGFTLLSWP